MEALHGRVRSLWSGVEGQVAAHHPDGGIEVVMDDGETLFIDSTDAANVAEWEWLGDKEVQ